MPIRAYDAFATLLRHYDATLIITCCLFAARYAIDATMMFFADAPLRFSPLPCHAADMMFDAPLRRRQLLFITRESAA